MNGKILFIIIGLLAYGIHYCSLFLPIISGYGTKYICSSIFIAGHDEGRQRAEDLAFFPLNYATFIVNHTDLSVTGSVFGFIRRKAIYRNGLGATLVNDFTEEQIRTQPFKVPTPPNVNQDDLPWPMGNKISDGVYPVNVNRALVQEAVDSLFIEKDPTKLIRTRAAIVVYDGALIAERYGTGYSRSTKFLGWSMTKSIISALVGILVKGNKLNIDAPAPVPEWNNTNDPRHSITIKHLLQQNSGLDFVEDYYSYSDVTRMLFSTGDMAAFAASHALKHKPGTYCYYTSANTNILSRIIRHTVGEQDYHSFPYRALFHKLGMNNMTMEVDASGTFVGSSYSWGTARDWARFGLLYMNKGFYNNEQILSEEWVKQSATLGGSNIYGEYGYQFWLNTGKENDSSTRRFPDVPTDMFFASGFDGQAVFVIPSKKLVVVRLGLTKTPDGEYGANNFLKTIIDAIS
ncbi:unnamed protein product [Adineta ricciae]|uniref:Beta-lactamase-related domain-containing protein n=1 Tax=Adineta ricciae TaxID=249248 RepID=A0A814HLF8_ADIRI|nr:unnamed protein product [Adineta ricciae]CAF1287444.1 unnamed protein product [Adineta ricciae]